MKFVSYKTTLAILAATVGMSVVPGTAHASLSSIRIVLCNTTADQRNINISGHNQNGHFRRLKVTLPAGNGRCVRSNGWWWHDALYRCTLPNGTSISSGRWTTVPPEANGTTRKIRPCAR